MQWKTDVQFLSKELIQHTKSFKQEDFWQEYANLIFVPPQVMRQVNYTFNFALLL